jgi:tRNA-dihydrouridine synthase
MIDETGCDAVMIGRASLGNPWIFRRTAHFLRTGELLPEPTYEERIAVALEHLRLAVELDGEEIGTREMRGQMAWYIKGIPGSSTIRRTLMESSTLEEMEQSLAAVCT